MSSTGANVATLLTKQVWDKKSNMYVEDAHVFFEDINVIILAVSLVHFGYITYERKLQWWLYALFKYM